MAEYVFGVLQRLLTKPFGYHYCDQGWTNGTEGTDQEGLCFPQLEANPDLLAYARSGTITIVNRDAPPEKVLWKLFSRRAIEYGTATSANCPPNTIPWNGSCFYTCPAGYTEHSYQTGEKNTDGSKKYDLECLAEMNGGWHPLTWTGSAIADVPGSSTIADAPGIYQSGAISFITSPIDKYPPVDLRSFAQLEALDAYWGYHTSDGQKSDPSNTINNSTSYTSVPLNITSSKGVVGKPVGQGSNTIVSLYDGYYGNRQRLKLGSPTMAGTCPPPNVATDSQCLRPTPSNMIQQGNQWITDQTCPAHYSTTSEEGLQCIPTPIVRKRYGSLLDMIIWLVTIIIIAFIAIKIVGIIRK